jgi:hypothetical protein
LDQQVSIDNYANKLYREQKHYDFNSLKLILSCFLHYEQSEKEEVILDTLLKDTFDEKVKLNIHQKIDGRYNAFYNHYLTEHGNSQEIPNNINVLSWNYDIQFELELQGGNSLNLTEQKLNIFPPNRVGHNPQKSSIVKINGTSGVFFDESGKSYDYVDLPGCTMVEEIWKMYNDQKNFRNESSLVFSFERQNENVIKSINLAQEIIRNTNILVVIGYSFSSGNWKVDKEILKYQGNIEEIYIQCPSSEFQRISTQNIPEIFNSGRDRIVNIPHLETFHIPVDV